MEKKYIVTIEDAAENCDEIYINETYDDLTTAQARYDELRGEFLSDDGGWRDGLELWLYESDDNGATQISIDGESK